MAIPTSNSTCGRSFASLAAEWARCSGLGQLTLAGIVRRSVRGNQVNFQANPECPIAGEIKSIVLKTAGVADVLGTALAPLSDRISLAFVYGSAAHGRRQAHTAIST